MKTVRTITPQELGPDPAKFQAKCRGMLAGFLVGTKCAWTSSRTKEQTTAEQLAADHIRATGHTVAIEEDEE